MTPADKKTLWTAVKWIGLFVLIVAAIFGAQAPFGQTAQAQTAGAFTMDFPYSAELEINKYF